MIKGGLRPKGIARVGSKLRIIPRKGRLTIRKVGVTPKKGTWGLKRTDTAFREHMLVSVPVRCVFPDCPISDPKKLTVSHYHGRVHKATRFNKQNCDLLCRNHHYWDKQRGWEFQKQTLEVHGWDGRYTVYMKEKLGALKFAKLKQLSATKLSPQKAIEQFRTSLTT